MAVVSNIVGGTTPTSAVVVVRVDSGADVRVAVSISGQDPTWFGPVTPTEAVTGHWVARVELTGLTPDTRYVWHSEHDGVEDTQYPGQLDTLPVVDEPASYTVAVIGDAGLTPETEGVAGSLFPTRISNHHAFETVRAHPTDPLMVCHLGDLHYYNPGDPNLSGDSLADYLRAWDDVLLQPRQHELYRTRAFQYMWDDHDYGPNDADGTHDGKENAAAAYRLRAPHHTLAQTSGAVYHSFQIGRVLYVSSDTRYDRTPNSEPDTSNKTYLGAAQKIWLENLLSSTDAQVMVWLMPNPWLGTLDDTWGGFTTERQELADLLSGLDVPASNGARTWAESLVMASADVHAIGLWSAGANPYGGFPGILCASIDASPSQAGGGQYDLGFQGGRDQYATIDVTDNGATITLTLTAWAGNLAWGQQALSFDAPFDPGPGPDPDPEPIPAPVPVAEARIRTQVTWLGVHRTTGRIIAELPDVTGDPARQLSAYSTSSLTVPVTRGGPGHVPVQLLEACTDGASGALVAVVNDIPIWMGLPVVQDNQMGRISLPSCPSTEAYLLKRKVRDLSAVDTDRARVALALAQQAEAINGLDGQGLGFEYDIEDTGDLITISYAASDRQTHYDAIRDLCVGGLEFEVYYDWADNSQTTVVKILRIRRRIGRVTGTPVAMFETGDAGSVIDYRETRSWAEGKYANHIVALAPGQGEDQPASAPAIDQAAIDAGVPWVELIVEPGNNITDPNLLDEFAQSQLARVKGGTSALTIDARLNAYPRPGVDASLGDQVSYLLESDRHPLTPTADLRLRGERRMTSMVIRPDQNTWTPGLVEDPLLGVS